MYSYILIKVILMKEKREKELRGREKYMYIMLPSSSTFSISFGSTTSRMDLPAKQTRLIHQRKLLRKGRKSASNKTLTCVQRRLLLLRLLLLLFKWILRNPFGINNGKFLFPSLSLSSFVTADCSFTE